MNLLVLYSAASKIPEYYEIIKNPMDLQTISSRLREGDYYRSKEAMLADLQLMV
jgi:hypothetical protein